MNPNLQTNNKRNITMVVAVWVQAAIFALVDENP